MHIFEIFIIKIIVPIELLEFINNWRIKKKTKKLNVLQLIE